ncbi:NAD(P)-binding protein [Armillaria borealis]|uniref:NAD(P)-binding protein n=1 Tax=Armillaria borealis TaxID=47425 RepID=A0AA39K3S3_9AGAR|nr:NAD(P)-binding protein [Armillaria borealis]
MASTSVSQGRVALVTGAGQGIGRAIALRLASDGFDVALNDLQANEANLVSALAAVEAIGRKGCYIFADVSQETEVEEMISKVVEELGGLDVMVCNAGISIMKSIFNTTAEDFDRITSVNLRGTFLCYKHAGKQMVTQGKGGRIIGACSGTGKKGQPLFSAYAASKFGIRGLTQVAALEFGPHGISVNAFAPGPVKTPMYDHFETIIGTPEGVLEQELNKTAALGRIALPEDIAVVVSFLASKETSLITGQTINVDGGIVFD